MIDAAFNDGELAPIVGPVLTTEWICDAGSAAGHRALSNRRQSIDRSAGLA